ncbi:MAG: class I SAM-dependent methyltransferase, partial [Gemmatimonadota bacterium]
ALSDLLAHAHALSLGATVETLTANFRESLLVPELDGLLMANSLHYVAYDEQAAFLARLRDRLRSGGRLIVVDYDGRAANQWVPFPVDKRQLARVCAELGWPAPTVVGSRASRYGGSIYAAYIDIPPSATGGERQG